MQDICRRVRDSGKTLTRGGETIYCHAPHASKESADNGFLKPLIFLYE